MSYYTGEMSITLQSNVHVMLVMEVMSHHDFLAMKLGQGITTNFKSYFPW